MNSRSFVVGALLLLVLGLVALLAAQVQIANAYHRTTVEGVLRAYARLGASRIEAAAYPDLWMRFAHPILTLADEDSIARYTFEFAPDRGLTVRRGSASAEEKAWLRDTLAAEIARYKTEWYFVAVFGAGRGDGRLVIFHRNPRGRLSGAVLEPDALAPVLETITHRTPLLPTTLTGGERLDSAGTVRFGTAGGTILYGADQWTATPFMGRQAFAPWLGGLWVEAALRPEIAGRLLIGGLPRSRTPIVLGVFALTAALTVAAMLLVRRESELARLRTELVAGVSHELRTPLAQIRMFSETLLLERVRSDEERERSLAIIDQEARRLTHLVENLLHFSRAERRLGRVTPRPVDLAEVVCGAVEGFTPLAAARRALVRAETPPTLPATADADAVRQIVLNLLDNALKYGPAEQSVTVALSATAGRARLTVDDQGPGIPHGDRERIWERFFRLPRDRTSAANGTGIGLAVVRELAALHGGRAWVESAPGGSGARFVVDWPLSQQAQPS